MIVLFENDESRRVGAAAEPNATVPAPAVRYNSPTQESRNLCGQVRMKPRRNGRYRYIYYDYRKGCDSKNGKRLIIINQYRRRRRTISKLWSGATARPDVRGGGWSPGDESYETRVPWRTQATSCPVSFTTRQRV